MAKRKKFPWFQKGDRVLTAYAESAAGPGWSNTPVWVIVRSELGVIRQECIQPEEQSGEIHALYRFSALAHGDMTTRVEQLLTKRSTTNG